MFLVALLLTTLVPQLTVGMDTDSAKTAADAETNLDMTPVGRVESKTLGGRVFSYADGYSTYNHGAKSYGRGYGGFGNRGYGGYNSYHGDGHRDYGRKDYGHKLVPIKIPYVDGNGCRFPGDVVCNANGVTLTTYRRCVLLNEGKNLWKKPSMTTVNVACTPAGTQAVTTFCNDNERILKAVGFIQEKEKDSVKRFHLGKYSVRLDPCIHV